MVNFCEAFDPLVVRKVFSFHFFRALEKRFCNIFDVLKYVLIFDSDFNAYC